jgi:hypothetical protein
MNKEWFNKKSRDNKIFYECRNLQTHLDGARVRESNIIRDVPLFQMKTIGLYEYVTVKNFLKVLKSSARFFELIDTGKKFISVGSQNLTYENQRFWDLDIALGASHCQEGQDGKLFKLVEVKTKELKKSDLEKLNRAFKKLQQKWRNTRKNR